MTRRLWIRAHALPDIVMRAGRVGLWTDAISDAIHPNLDPNEMVVVEIDDMLANFVSRDAYLMHCGKVLAEGEKPPYAGSDPGRERVE